MRDGALVLRDENDSRLLLFSQRAWEPDKMHSDVTPNRRGLPPHCHAINLTCSPVISKQAKFLASARRLFNGVRAIKDRRIAILGQIASCGFSAAGSMHRGRAHHNACKSVQDDSLILRLCFFERYLSHKRRSPIVSLRMQNCYHGPVLAHGLLKCALRPSQSALIEQLSRTARLYRRPGFDDGSPEDVC